MPGWEGCLTLRDLAGICPRFMEAARTIRPGDGHYPSALQGIEDRPASLRVLGDLGAGRRRVAVVGARDSDDYGRDMAGRIGAGLARAGVSVVSGGARGIDAAAHRGALQAGGHTVAVLGQGIAAGLTAEQRELLDAVRAGGGAVVSEYEDAAPAARWTFPKRNRIVSGMSEAVVVVRAGEGSGALITAAWARQQGVPVFAVPGDADHPLSAGPIGLLRTGARVAASADDVLEALGIAPQPPLPLPAPDGLGEGARSILANLGPRPRHADELARASGLPAGAALAALLELELGGHCEQRPGHYFLRRCEG
jgi:DNA processing protein